MPNSQQQTATQGILNQGNLDQNAHVAESAIPDVAHIDGITRILEEVNIFFHSISSAITDFILKFRLHDHDDTTLSESAEVGNIAGVSIAVLAASIWIAIRNRFTKDDPFANSLLSIPGNPKLNPWYRRWKTANFVLSDFFELLIYAIFSFIPGLEPFKIIVSKIVGAVLGALFSIAAVILLNDNLDDGDSFIYKLGKDGWTKYNKTGAVYGGRLFALVFGIAGLLLPIPGGFWIGMAVGGLVGIVAGFAATALLVPLINKIRLFFSKNTSEQDKTPPTYRSNYIRAGIVVGEALFITLFALLGTVICPGLGTALGAGVAVAISGLVGSIVGGIVLGIAGHFISKLVDPQNKAANSWDYGVRTGGTIFGGIYGIGAILTAFVPKQFATIAVAASTLVCAAIGGIYEICNAITRKARGEHTSFEEKHSIPWTQSAASGAVVVSLIVGFIGFMLAGPIGASLGAGIGGLVGGIVIGLFCSKPWKKQNPTPLEQQNKEKQTFKDNSGDSFDRNFKAKTMNSYFLNPTTIEEVKSKNPIPKVTEKFQQAGICSPPVDKDALLAEPEQILKNKTPYKYGLKHGSFNFFTPPIEIIGKQELIAIPVSSSPTIRSA